MVRFCRSVGCGGFGDLRLALARAEGAPSPAPARMHRRIGPGTGVAEAADAVLAVSVAALEGVRARLDAAAVERAALALVRAERVEIWGFGASAAVAGDLAHKLFRVCRGSRRARTRTSRRWRPPRWTATRSRCA